MLFLVGRSLPDCFARQALQQKRNDKPQIDLASQFLTGSGSTALYFGFIDERIERALLCSLVSMFLFFLQRECCVAAIKYTTLRRCSTPNLDVAGALI